MATNATEAVLWGWVEADNLRAFLDNPWLCWGLGPLVAVNVGHFVPLFVLEFVLSTGLAANAMIEYGVKGRSYKPRAEAVKLTQKKVSYAEQWRVATLNMLGPMAILNSVLSSLLLPYFLPTPANLTPSLAEFLLHFVLLELVGDFFLYVFHRLEHEYFWDFHKYHHMIDTPTPVSTVCIDSVDATLQAGLPLLLSSIIVRPHPLTNYAYMAARLFENVANHSGIDHWLLDLVLLKVLPGRASVAHHDSHHKYSNHAGHSKNLAENFWIFDWMFGTLGKTSAAGKPAAQTEPDEPPGKSKAQ